MKLRASTVAVVLLPLVVLAGCGGGSDKAAAQARPGNGRPGMGGGAWGGPAGGGQAAARVAVPVQVASVERRDIARYLETNGILEAEDSVDIIARVAGPISQIAAEEGMEVRRGTLLARLDERELVNQVQLAEVTRNEAALAFERARTSFDQQLISQQAYDQAITARDAAGAQLDAKRIQLSYATITAPFDGLIVSRYVKQAQHVTNGTPLFRIADFDPLLCPIEVPEKELARLRLGQRARIRVEAYPGEEFSASVLRLSPVVDATTGTVRVTLEVDGRRLLRPGMFGSVFLEMDTHPDAVVVPRQALVLGTLGDAVFVVAGETAERRGVRAGFREADAVEILDGVAPGERVVVLGQEALSDGTPVTVIDGNQAAVASATAQPRPDTAESSPVVQAPSRGEQPAAAASEQPQAAPVAVERPAGAEPQPRLGPPAGGPGGGAGGGMRERLMERIRNASPEELEQIKSRMRERGMSDEQIDAMVKAAREGSRP